jgi:hypothetical protein
MNKIIMSVAVAAALLCSTSHGTAGFPAVHQEEIQQQLP